MLRDSRKILHMPEEPHTVPHRLTCPWIYSKNCLVLKSILAWGVLQLQWWERGKIPTKRKECKMPSFWHIFFKGGHLSMFLCSGGEKEKEKPIVIHARIRCWWFFDFILYASWLHFASLEYKPETRCSQSSNTICCSIHLRSQIPAASHSYTAKQPR